MDPGNGVARCPLGFALGEAAGLTREAVNLQQLILTIDRQVGRDGKLGPPKSSAGVRTCAMPQVLAGLLGAQLERVRAEIGAQALAERPWGGRPQTDHIQTTK